MLKDYRDMLIGGGVLILLLVAGQFSNLVARELIHFFSAAGVYLLVYLTLDSIGRRTGVTWMTKRVEPAALVALVLIWFGEPDDVPGDGVWKSYIDIAVWAVGFVASILALRRWCWSRRQQGEK